MESQNTEPLEEIEEVVEEVVEEVQEVEDNSIQAPKKARTQKQIDAFQKVIEKRNENRKMRAEQKLIIKEQDKVILENKIIQKAVSIKKKQIKKELVLDDISDDDEPIEEIKQKIVKSKKKVVPPLPPLPQTPVIPQIQYSFV